MLERKVNIILEWGAKEVSNIGHINSLAKTPANIGKILNYHYNSPSNLCFLLWLVKWYSLAPKPHHLVLSPNRATLWRLNKSMYDFVHLMDMGYFMSHRVKCVKEVESFLCVAQFFDVSPASSPLYIASFSTSHKQSSPSILHNNFNTNWG